MGRSPSGLKAIMVETIEKRESNEKQAMEETLSNQTGVDSDNSAGDLKRSAIP